jgi:S-adenosylmethionine:tRNA ribosyltransferase-isomerase
MKTSDFDYFLPKELIAQDPLDKRDTSRLLAYNAGDDEVEHRQFFELRELLREGDVLVVNRSKVIPARILFDVEGRECEVFLLKKVEEAKYQVMVKPGKVFKEGARFVINEGLSCEVEAVLDDGTRVVEFTGGEDEVEAAGVTPLPPYITDSHARADQYQTVYAEEEGSVAASTAGLHFTDELLDELRGMGVRVEEVVLHVGRGTFLPVKTENIKDHVMHEEGFELSAEVAEVLNKAKSEGRRVIAVGTTSVRVLETCCVDGKFVPQVSSTNIYIYPGYKWKAVDALITNFHLPKSTLLMLVSSFLENKGVERPIEKLLELYGIAKAEKYRFYSFGDAMFIH